MTVRFSDNWQGRTAGAVVHGTNFNNALGGSGTTAIERSSASHYVVAATTAGFLAAGNPASSFIGGVAGNAGVFDGKIRMLVDISAGRSAVRLKGAGPTAPNGIQVTLSATHTSLQLSGGNGTPAKSITAPAGNFWLELEILDLTMTARVFNASDMSLHDSFAGVLTSTRNRGPYWSGLYGAASTPINSLLGSIVMDDMATGAAPPTISSVTAAKNGKYAATGVITSTGADGKVFYKWYEAAESPVLADVMGSDTSIVANWTAAGALNVSTAGLGAGKSYKLAVVRRDAGLNMSTLVVSSTFTTDAPLPAPTGATTRTVSGQTVRVLYTPGAQQVDSVSVSIPPAAVSPGGAVLQGPVSAAYDSGLAKWVAEFTGVPAGGYADAVTLASNADNASVSITGATGFSIVGINGQPTAPDATPPADTEAPQMQGTVSLSSLTHNSYTTGVDAATDNVAVTGYRVSQDGGSTWIDKGTSRTHNHTGRTPGATDQVRWSARDEAGNWATPLSRAVQLNAAPDTTAPVMTGSIAVSAKTHNSYTLTWPAATDAVGVTGYEYSLNGGTSYTDAGAVLTVNITGRTPSATDQVRVRAYDAAGNKATPLSASVTLDAAPDTQVPVMAGAIASSLVTQTSYSIDWPAATDNVAVTGYEVSLNGGTTYTDNGTARTRAVTGRTPGSTDQVRVRAYDAAGNRATPLSLSVALQAGGGTLPPGPGGRIEGFSAAAFFQMLAMAGES